MHEPYFLYYEDVDAALSLARAGWRIAVARDAVATQYANAAPPYLVTRNQLHLIQRWGSRRARWLAQTRALAQISRDVITSAAGRPRPWRQRSHGLIDYWRGYYPVPPPSHLVDRLVASE